MKQYQTGKQFSFCLHIYSLLIRIRSTDYWLAVLLSKNKEDLFMKVTNQKVERQRQKLQQEYEKNELEIQQLRNRQTVLLNQKRAEERKIRTHRLIEQGAVLESLLPKVKDMTAEEVKAFLMPVVDLLE